MDKIRFKCDKCQRDGKDTVVEKDDDGMIPHYWTQLVNRRADGTVMPPVHLCQFCSAALTEVMDLDSEKREAVMRYRDTANELERLKKDIVAAAEEVQATDCELMEAERELAKVRAKLAEVAKERDEQKRKADALEAEFRRNKRKVSMIP